MTTEERIAQIAQGFGQGIQNFQQGQDRQRAQELQDTARRRQEALQALEVSNQLSQQTGRQIDPSAIQPFLQSGDLSGINDILSSGEMTPQAIQKQSDRERQAQMQSLDMQQKQANLNELNAPFGQSREAQKLAYQEGLRQKNEQGPKAVLSKLSGETQGKVGGIASGMQALDSMEKSILAGYSPSYIDANTPVIGGLMSDTPFTESQRVLSEVVGRLQSGGAINDDEGKRFVAMGPRPGDSQDSASRKLQNQRDFLNNKLAGYGLKGDDLGALGFAVKAPDIKKKDSSNVPGIPEAQASDHMETAKGMTLDQKKALLRRNR